MSDPNNIYTDGVELICPAVYIADSAAEALSYVVAELSEAVEAAYNAYGVIDNASEAEPVDYFSMLDDED